MLSHKHCDNIHNHLSFSLQSSVTLCAYPFILNAQAKTTMLQTDAELQMQVPSRKGKIDLLEDCMIFGLFCLCFKFNIHVNLNNHLTFSFFLADLQPFPRWQ